MVSYDEDACQALFHPSGYSQNLSSPMLFDLFFLASHSRFVKIGGIWTICTTRKYLSAQLMVANAKE